MAAVYIPNCIGEQAADSTGKRPTEDNVAETNCQLPPGVEEGQVDDKAGEQRAFDQPQKQPTGEEALIVLDETCEGGYDAPKDRNTADETGGAQLL